MHVGSRRGCPHASQGLRVRRAVALRRWQPHLLGVQRMALQAVLHAGKGVLPPAQAPAGALGRPQAQSCARLWPCCTCTWSHANCIGDLLLGKIPQWKSRVCVQRHMARTSALYRLSLTCGACGMQIRANARALGDRLMSYGHKLVTDGTDNHLVLWILRDEVRPTVFAAHCC